jgi:hypothetical protein
MLSPTTTGPGGPLAKPENEPLIRLPVTAQGMIGPPVASASLRPDIGPGCYAAAGVRGGLPPAPLPIRGRFRAEAVLERIMFQYEHGFRPCNCAGSAP